jgi:hypothetical protein
MKKLILLTTLAFAAIVSYAQTATTPVVDINKVLEFKNAEYNAGQTIFGNPVAYTVEIKNISNDTVTLLTAKAGCGCTTPNFTPNQKFGPGQVAKVNITFNGGQKGPYTKVTDIYFDKGLTRQVKLTGEGVVPAPPPAADASAATPVKAKSDKN